MSRLSFHEVEIFLTDLTALVRSGVPVPEGLRELAKNFDQPRLKALAEHVAKSTEQGLSIQKALETAPQQIPEGIRAAFACAETSGDSRALLEFTAEHARALRSHRSEVITAAFYPMMMFLAMLGVFVFFAILVVPRFEDIFRQLGAELPRITQLIINISTFATSSIIGPPLLALVAAATLLVLISDRARDYFFQLLALLPGYASLVALSDTAIFMKYLGTMLAKGVPMQDALTAIRSSVMLGSTRDSIDRMSEAARRGQPVGEHMSALFPATAVHLFQQGEKTGRLPEVCSSLGEWADASFRLRGRRTTGMIEPIAIAFLMIGLGVLVISFFLPLVAIPRLIR